MRGRKLGVRVGLAAGVWATVSANGQVGRDPQLDPASPGAAAQTTTQPATQPAGQTPAQTGPAPVTPAPPMVHPATALGPDGVHDDRMVAPPPGWQLARTMLLNGRLYYAVADAQAYLQQAGWTQPAVVHKKHDTGFRFDLILAPAPAQRTAVSRSVVGGYTTLRYGSGRISLGGVIDPDFVYPSYGEARYAGPIDGQLSPGYTQPIPEPEPVQLTLVEQAGLELGFGEPERAVGLYRQHLEAQPEDASAMRSLGIALLMAGRVEDAAATVRYAHATDPDLAREPLGLWIVGDSSRKMRAVTTQTVRWAHDADTASAWLLVAVLMQADGKIDPALAMVERAADRGLDEPVAGALRSELTRR